MKKVILLIIMCGLFGVLSAQKQSFSIKVGGGDFNINSSTPVKQKNIGKAFMEVAYDYCYLRDTSDVASVKKDLMSLQIGEGLSKFYSYRAKMVDSLVAVSSLDQISSNPEQYVGGETFSVYKNYPNGKLTFVDKISVDWFCYEEQMPEFNWIFVDEKKDILGYSCKRAECDFRGRKYIAWYAEEIAVSEGPWKFKGLPGLIMEVADCSGFYCFTIVGIKQNSGEITIPDVQFIKTSRSKYYSTKLKFDIDPVTYVMNASGVNVKVMTPDGKPYEGLNKQDGLKFEYIERDCKY